MRPPPVPKLVARTVSPAGAVHCVVDPVLSDQYDTRLAPVTPLGTTGETWEAVVPGSPPR